MIMRNETLTVLQMKCIYDRVIPINDPKNVKFDTNTTTEYYGTDVLINLHTKDTDESNYAKSKQKVNNKETHTINGNPEILNKQINIIQINSSNANFNSKLEELVVTMERQKADVCVISESNMEHSNPVKMTERKSKFPQYNIVDKIISNHISEYFYLVKCIYILIFY